MALTERLALIIDAHTGGAISEFRKVGAEAKKLGGDVDATGGFFDKLGAKAGASGGAVKAAFAGGAVVAVGLLGDAAKNAVEKFVNMGEAVHEFQLASGASAEDASRLLNVVHALGVDPASAEKAFFLLGKSIGSGKSKLDDFGVSVAKNKDGTTDLTGTLANVADAYQHSGDAAQRDAIAAAAFGKGAAALLPVLTLTRSELTALGNTGPVFTEKQVENAHQLEVAMHQVGLLKDKVESKVGGYFAEQIAGNLEITKKLTFGLVDLTSKKEADTEVDKKNALTKIQAAKDAAEATKAERQAYLDLRGGILATQDAQTAYVRSVQSVGDAERTLAEKQKALSDLQKKGAVDAKAVEAATLSLAQATRSLEQAQTRAADAKKALDTALAGPTADDLAGAQLDLQDATLSVADANDSLTDAQKAVNDAQAANDPVALAKANRDLEHASLNLERAQRTQAAAQKAVNDLDPNSEAGAQRIATAYTALKDANQAVDDANRGVLTSTQALNTARAGDPDFADKLATAYIGVRDAQNGVADAGRAELTAVLNLADARYQQAALLGAGGDAAERLKGEVAQLASLYPQIAPLLGGLLGSGGPALGPTLAGGSGDGRTLTGARSSGGPTTPGNWLVGEDGPEVLHLGSSGYVTPNRALGGGGDTFNVYMPPGSDGDDVVAALRRYQQRNGSVPIRVNG